MGSIPEIVSYLEFGRAELLQSVAGLSHREMTQIPTFDDWTVKDVLAHIIGWDQWTLEILPLILQNRAGEIAGINPDVLNQQTVKIWRDKPLSEVLSTIHTTHRQILDIIAGLDHIEIDTRRARGEQTITIRSYVIDIMVEHERQHAEQIHQWREALDSSINPQKIKQALAQNRARVLAAIEGLNEDDLLDKTAAGTWSVKDVIGHLADWEQRMLKGARHIHNPELKAVSPVSAGENILDWNEVMAAKQAKRPWPEVIADLTETRQALRDFLAQLKPRDWSKRGPYPWPHAQGTLAELIGDIAAHDAEHLLDLEEWHRQKINE
ncbi:MAG: DinB family protein [Anaerolineae bacterium]|nr:DinB family protein [Anaerolineae bacterium]